MAHKRIQIVKDFFAALGRAIARSAACLPKISSGSFRRGWPLAARTRARGIENVLQKVTKRWKLSYQSPPSS